MFHHVSSWYNSFPLLRAFVALEVCSTPTQPTTFRLLNWRADFGPGDIGQPFNRSWTQRFNASIPRIGTWKKHWRFTILHIRMVMVFSPSFWWLFPCFPMVFPCGGFLKQGYPPSLEGFERKNPTAKATDGQISIASLVAPPFGDE